MITQEALDKLSNEKWRTIVLAIAMLHSVVQERRKFGPLGWCIPYEFNYSDLEASLFVVEKHLAATVLVGQPLSWSTIGYMVGEVQYGGRITDDLDREVTYSAGSRAWRLQSLVHEEWADGEVGVPRRHSACRLI